MNTDARRGGAGFSFVELLITIVIAGIAFAAMVPLFVQAQKQTSADNMRNVTMQIAQEKIEKIRMLDYDQVTQANLDDEAFYDGAFGNSYLYQGGSGSTRTLTVTYVVSKVPATLSDGTETPDGRENYKQVEVEVSWSGPPEPVRPSSLTTSIYRQYAGAAIRTFNVGPATIFEVVDGKYTITGGPVVLDAYIAPEDIEGMNADLGDPTIPEIKRRMGYVKFVISAQNGTDYVSEAVYIPVTGEPGHYQFTWDNSEAPDGVYVFAAIAVSGTQQQGTSASVAFSLAALSPPAPTGLIAFVGDGVAYLSWDTAPIGDFGHYEVYRSDDGVTFTLLAGDLPAPTYTDTGLTNGATYYYQVRVADDAGNLSDPSATITVVPEVVDDTTPPTVPGSFTATAVPDTPTVALSWGDATDLKSGVRGYIIERSADGATWIEIQGDYSQTAYTDVSAGWGSTWFYRVKAVDNVGNASAYATAGPVTTDPLPMRTLAVTNNEGIHLYVWVRSVTTGMWYTSTGVGSLTQPTGTKILKTGGSKTWVNLPAGIYNVVNDDDNDSTIENAYPPQAVDLSYADGSVTL
jgi:type II secretory pathway pseudopilin PulG